MKPLAVALLVALAALVGWAAHEAWGALVGISKLLEIGFGNG